MKATFDKSHTQANEVVNTGLSHSSERMAGVTCQRETVVRPLQHLHKAEVTS